MSSVRVIATKVNNYWTLDIDPNNEASTEDVNATVRLIEQMASDNNWTTGIVDNIVHIIPTSDAEFTGALKRILFELEFKVPIPPMPPGGNVYPTNYEVPCAAAAAEEAAEAAEAAARSGRPVLIDSMAYARHPSFIPSTSDDEYAAELDREAEALVDILDDSDMEVDLVSGACPMSELIHTSSICLRL